MNTTLLDNNYRFQRDFPCCMTCEHSDHYGGDIECLKAKGTAYVSAIGICDEYEKETP